MNARGGTHVPRYHNYPLVAHLRWLFEDIRPEFHQYFVENDIDGRPFDRNRRSLIYERAKAV